MSTTNAPEAPRRRRRPSKRLRRRPGGTAETSVAAGHRKRAAKYEEGQKVKIYYDPKDRSMATLEPGEPGGIFTLAMVGGVFVLVDAILIVMSILAPQP